MKLADTTYVIGMVAYCPECGYGQRVELLEDGEEIVICYCLHCSAEYQYKNPPDHELDNIVSEFEGENK